MYGKDQPIALQLLGSERSKEALEGVAMELEDSLYPLLREVRPRPRSMRQRPTACQHKVAHSCGRVCRVEVLLRIPLCNPWCARWGSVTMLSVQRLKDVCLCMSCENALRMLAYEAVPIYEGEGESDKVGGLVHVLCCTNCNSKVVPILRTGLGQPAGKGGTGGRCSHVCWQK